jgi:hypothetical protein
VHCFVVFVGLIMALGYAGPFRRARGECDVLS